MNALSVVVTVLMAVIVPYAGAAELGKTKPAQKPVKRTAWVAPTAERASVERVSAAVSSGASRAPAPKTVATPARAATRTPRPDPLFREDVTLEEMHRYHQ